MRTWTGRIRKSLLYRRTHRKRCWGWPGSIIMEENTSREQECPEVSSRGEESNRVILPLLQPLDNQQSHRITNFYIDNILRPDFGQKRKDRTLVLERDSLQVIIGRERLSGRNASKTVSQQQGGAESEEDTGASDDQCPHPESGRADLIADVAVKVRKVRCSSPQTGSAPEAKTMLWPAWVYCTRYSDRPSSGWWINLFSKPLFVNIKRNKKPRYYS